MTLRVLHAPGIAGGNAAELARAERALGLDSRCVAFDENPMDYEVDERVAPSAGRLRFELARWRWLWRAWRDFDVIHFNFGQSFMPQYLPAAGHESGCTASLRALYHRYAKFMELRDIAFLKSRGKAVFMTYQGDDARQGDYCRSHFEITFADKVPPGYYTEASDKAKRRRIATVDRCAHGIFALNPDLLHVLPQRARFLPYANVDLRQWAPEADTGNIRPVLVHAPSHTAVKGTGIVLEVVRRLKECGAEFDFILVQGRTRSEALAAYRRADLCIDQLFAGWYGGLAVELMALGKPVATFLREADLHFLPNQMRAELPLVRVTPSTLFEVLRGLLAQPRDEWVRLGVASRKFVERWHDPLRIAGQLLGSYQAALAACEAPGT